MEIKEDKTIVFFWIVISFILAFNELIALYMPKMIIRGTYIIVLFLVLTKIIMGNSFVLRLRKIEIVLVIYILMHVSRLLIQMIQGNINDASYVCVIQATVPIFGFFLAERLTDRKAITVEVFFSICAAISIVMGILNIKYSFLPEKGAFLGTLYANIGGALATRGYSMAGSALITGALGALAVCFLAYFETEENRILKRVLLCVCAVGCMLSLSRGAFAFLIVFFVVYWFAKYRGKKKLNKKIVWCTVIVAMLILVICLKEWNVIINSSLYRRFIKVGVSLADHSNENRLAQQSRALKSMTGSWLIGKGFGIAGNQAFALNPQGYINTESSFIVTLMNLGVFGTLFYVYIPMTTILYAFKKKQILYYKYLGIVVGMFVWSLVYILLDSDLIALFYWYCIGRIWKKRISNYEENNVLYAYRMELD